jgi:hypothetical protein
VLKDAHSLAQHSHNHGADGGGGPAEGGPGGPGPGGRGPGSAGASSGNNSARVEVALSDARLAMRARGELLDPAPHAAVRALAARANAVPLAPPPPQLATAGVRVQANHALTRPNYTLVSLGGDEGNDAGDADAGDDDAGDDGGSDDDDDDDGDEAGEGDSGSDDGPKKSKRRRR